MKHEKLAAAKAELYIQHQNISPKEVDAVMDDYTAGYLEGLKEMEEKVRFLHQHMGIIMALADEHDELYSLSYARFAMEKMR